MAWRCYGTFSSLLYSAMRFYSGFRHVRYTDTGWFQSKNKKNSIKRNKEKHIAEGRKEKRYCHRRSYTPSMCNVYFSFGARRAQSHTLSFSHWHLHCTFPCAATNASYIKRIYFMYKRETALWINAYGTIVIKNPSRVFLSRLVIDDKEKLGSHENVTQQNEISH